MAGAWSGTDSEWWVSATSAQTATGGTVPKSPNTYLFLFAIGPVFFCVWGTSAAHLLNEFGTEFEPRGSLGSRMRQVCPVAPGDVLQWPPGAPLEDADLESLQRGVPEFMRLVRMDIAQREARKALR